MSSGLELKPPTEPPSLEGLDFDERVEAMAQWFHSNFEDPAQETPYESAEGGYQWIWGGPYDAQEELADAFAGEATEEELEAAVNEVTRDGLYDWAPAGIRIQPDDLDDLEDERRPPLNQQLEALRGDLDDLEQYVQHWRNNAPLIGHNRPPEELRLGLSQDDLDDAQASIDELRAELDKPNPADDGNAEVIERAQGRFAALRAKVLGWAKVVGAAFVLGAAKAAGEELWSDPNGFVDKLSTIGATLGNWLHHLAPLF